MWFNLHTCAICIFQAQALVGFEKTVTHLDEHLVDIGTKVSIHAFHFFLIIEEVILYFYVFIYLHVKVYLKKTIIEKNPRRWWVNLFIWLAIGNYKTKGGEEVQR